MKKGQSDKKFVKKELPSIKVLRKVWCKFLTQTRGIFEKTFPYLEIFNTLTDLLIVYLRESTTFFSTFVKNGDTGDQERLKPPCQGYVVALC